MPNPSSPLRADRKTPQSREHRYIGALFADDYGGMRTLTLATANGFARKKLDAASQSLQLRSERQTATARRIEARAAGTAERGLQAEIRESDRRIALFWRRMTTKVRPDKTIRHSPSKARTRVWPYASVALPKYDGPLIDRRGERGVFVKFRYYSRRTAKAGVSQRVLLYCYNGAALDEDGVPYVHSNIGETIDEALCGLDHLEQVNWSAQEGAKLLLHGFLSVDHRQTPDEMMRVGARWAEETLGRFDLPYVVTLHAPPEDGDQRNWHLHVLWSFRPMVRTGDHEWEVAEMLRTDLDNPAAMKVFREMYAAVMTDVSFETGQNQVWTAKSNADRGLVHEPQVSLGAARTNRARQGEYMPANEENHERVLRSKAAALDEQLRHADEALAKQQAIDRAIAGRWARLLELPMQVPHRTIATMMTENLPEVSAPGQRASITFVPVISPPIAQARVRSIGSLAPPKRISLPRVADTDQAALPGGRSVLPDAPARAVPPEIANLRFRAIPRSDDAIMPVVRLPIAKPTVSGAVRLPVITTSEMPGIAIADRFVMATLPIRTMVSPPAVSAPVNCGVARAETKSHATALPARPAVISAAFRMHPVMPPLPIADISVFTLTITQARDALRRDDERRERERVEAARKLVAATERVAADERRLALARLFAAIAEERHYLERTRAGPIVDPRLLARFGLKPGDVGAEDACRRLLEIASTQQAEVLRIDAHVRIAPQDIVQDSDGWLLGDNAPADVRALAKAWRKDATMQQALGRVVSARPIAALPVEEIAAPLVDLPNSAWRRARAMRDQLMAESDAVERLDGQGLPQPSLRIARPGTDLSVQPNSVARRFPGLPGSEIAG